MNYKFKTHTDFTEDGKAIKCFAADDYMPNSMLIHEGKGGSGRIHRHPNIELKYIFSGRLDMTLGERKISASAGTLVISGSNIYHGYTAADSMKYCTIIFNTDYVSALVSTPEPLDFIPVIKDDKTVERIFSTLEKEYFERPLMYRQNADALFHELLIHLIRNYANNTFEYSPVSLNGGIANAVNDFLSHNFHKKLTIEAIADTMGFNRHYMMRAFKKETGVTIAQQLHEIRLNHAKNLLRNTLKSIADVAQLSGFESVSHFSRLFKEETGKTPAEYRNQYIS